jgi:hypothetical protein
MNYVQVKAFEVLTLWARLAELSCVTLVRLRLAGLGS